MPFISLWKFSKNEMKRFSKISTIFYFLFSIFILTIEISIAQFNPIHHYNNEKNSWYNDVQYNHSALQPIYSEDTTSYQKSNRKYWFGRKLYDEHLYHSSKNNTILDVNFLPDMYIGKEGNKTIWNNTRALQLSGKVNSNFSFDFTLYETQVRLPSYMDTLSVTLKSIPGQGWHEIVYKQGTVYDYTYATAHIAYRAGNFNFQLANDKLFIGDGYRSLLLSDVSIPYPYFKATYESKKFQYSAIYMQHIDQFAPKLSEELGFQKKWAVMHYLDWNISKKWTIGLFDAVIWQDADSTGKRGFEVSYANPIIFLRAAEYATSSSDNALIGMNVKYQARANTKIYAQLAFDELKISEYIASNGWWANKFAVQLGVRSRNLAGIENLNGFTEMNLVKPYTYTHKNTQRSYTNYGDALAHPLGANFIENVSRLEYKYKRWMPMLQINFAKYGLDSVSGTNVGKDILASYNTRDKEYGNKLLQGIPASLFIVDARIAYMLNPKINMRLELGYTYRNEIVSGTANSTNIITFGLRSSFRNLYFDR